MSTPHACVVCRAPVQQYSSEHMLCASCAADSADSQHPQTAQTTLDATLPEHAARATELQTAEVARQSKEAGGMEDVKSSKNPKPIPD